MTSLATREPRARDALTRTRIPAAASGIARRSPPAARSLGIALQALTILVHRRDAAGFAAGRPRREIARGDERASAEAAP